MDDNTDVFFEFWSIPQIHFSRPMAQVYQAQAQAQVCDFEQMQHNLTLWVEEQTAPDWDIIF